MCILADRAEKAFPSIVFSSSANLCNLKILPFICSLQFLSSFVFCLFLLPLRSRDTLISLTFTLYFERTKGSTQSVCVIKAGKNIWGNTHLDWYQWTTMQIPDCNHICGSLSHKHTTDRLKTAARNQNQCRECMQLYSNPDQTEYKKQWRVNQQEAEKHYYMSTCALLSALHINFHLNTHSKHIDFDTREQEVTRFWGLGLLNAAL